MLQWIQVNPAGCNTVPSAGRELRFIVVHYTALKTSEMGRALYVSRRFEDAKYPSADFIVDNEFVVQFNPDLKNRCCKHCGGRGGERSESSLYGICTNENSIGVEMCSENAAGKVTFPGDPNYYFTDAVLENAAELIRSLMTEYHIDLSHVVRHYDVNGKLCPGVPGWFGPEEAAPGWAEFKNGLR